MRYEFLCTFQISSFGVEDKCFVDSSSPPSHFFNFILQQIADFDTMDDAQAAVHDIHFQT